MKLRLISLTLALKRGDVTVPFGDTSYFWGQMGAGKSSIAKLIDYCLGAAIELTPAMQMEFVGATLQLTLTRSDLSLTRERESDKVVAQWQLDGEPFQALLPAREAAGEVIPGTGVENLSDLIFWLSNMRPPRVRRSKQKQETETNRLSIRDLSWYCYLDQDEIDSSFFHLDEGAHTFKRLKSRDVLRYVIGFHDEHVAELEAELDQLRGERLALASAMDAMKKALHEVGLESEIQIGLQARHLVEQANAIAREIELARMSPRFEQTAHAGDDLKARALTLGRRLSEVDRAIEDLRAAHMRDVHHLSEIETLSLKFRRSNSARAVLGGVVFVSCPKCTQDLPTREHPGSCQLCGQIEESVGEIDTALVERDIKSRASELREITSRHEAAIMKLLREREEIQASRVRIERERNEAMRRFDSAYLSEMLTKEREQAALLQEAQSMASLARLPKLLATQQEKLDAVQIKEARVRSLLKEARQAAESDATNLNHLKTLFLDCLVRTGVPGISLDDIVEIPTTTFYPAIRGSSAPDAPVTSFATLSSGGKKTLFKCCFAVALHRLRAQLRAPLPELLIIDSPMKNISERENREQFEQFYHMLYELKSGELKETQLVLIDKEFAPPAIALKLTVLERHMRPDDPEFPPLIPYYRGK